MSHQASCDEITRALDQLTIDNNDSGLSPQAAALNQKLSETQRQIVLHVLLLNHTVICNPTREGDQMRQKDKPKINQHIIVRKQSNHRHHGSPKHSRPSTLVFQPRRKSINSR